MTNIKDDNGSLVMTIDEHNPSDKYAAAIAAIAVRELRGDPMDIKTIWRVLRSMGMPDFLDVAVQKKAKTIALEFTEDISEFDDVHLLSKLKDIAKNHVDTTEKKGQGSVCVIAVLVVLVVIGIVIYACVNG